MSRRGDSASPLGQVRGLGSANHGGTHWLKERFTAVAMLILGLWFLFSLLMLPGYSLDTVKAWLSGPYGAVPMALFIITCFIHGHDGLKVVIEDYVHDEGNKIFLTFLLSMTMILGAGLALFALAKIALGAA